jgi:RNA-binding protein 8A
LIEYATQGEAQASIDGADGEKLLEQTIHVDYAFVRAPPNKGRHGQGGAAAGGGRQGGASGGGRRGRSRSPEGVKDEDDEKDKEKEKGDGDQEMVE